MNAQIKLGVQTLERDAASLFSLVDSICARCDEQRESPAYLEPNRTFFLYIRELGDATKAFLNTFPSKAPTHPRLYQSYRQKLETLRSGWFAFHSLIKPSMDADTLSMPHALLQALSRRFNTVKGFDKTRFAIFHSDDLNYFQVRATDIARTAQQIRQIIPDAPDFAADLGMIGIPYSQAASLYLNSLIPHEMGHFVFQRSDKKSELLPDIGRCLEAVFGSNFRSVPAEDQRWSSDRLAGWAEELFCDLFAIWLVGPCYSISYIDLFGLTTLLNLDAPSGYSASRESRTFQRSHPADVFRLKQHVQLLEKPLGWWQHIGSLRTHYLDVLRCSSDVQDTDFVFSTSEKDQTYAQNTLTAFLKLVPKVFDLVSQTMIDVNPGVNEYKKYGELVEHYLANAVVPSTIFDGKEHWYPSPVAVMNSSVKFQLESLDQMMKNVEEQKPSLAGHRSRWVKRLEALTAKAIEDHNLLTGEKGAIRVGDSFKRADIRSPK